jgi:hypothetical protein
MMVKLCQVKPNGIPKGYKIAGKTELHKFYGGEYDSEKTMLLLSDLLQLTIRFCYVDYYSRAKLQMGF